MSEFNESLKAQAALLIAELQTKMLALIDSKELTVSETPEQAGYRLYVEGYGISDFYLHTRDASIQYLNQMYTGYYKAQWLEVGKWVRPHEDCVIHTKD